LDIVVDVHIRDVNRSIRYYLREKGGNVLIKKKTLFRNELDPTHAHVLRKINALSLDFWGL
jgi:hypothetical protein